MKQNTLPRPTYSPLLTPPETCLFEVLRSARVFARGGVLVGTHALRCYGPLLRINFPEGMVETTGIDIAVDLEHQCEPPSKKLPEYFGECKLRIDSTGIMESRFIARGEDVFLDFLMPRMRSDGLVGARWIWNLRTYGRTVLGLDYLLAKTQPTYVRTKRGRKFKVMVPDPARFALYLLMVAERRKGIDTRNPRRELNQAATLLQALLPRHSQDLQQAWMSTRARPDRLRAAVKASALRLPEPLLQQLHQVLPRFVSPALREVKSAPRQRRRSGAVRRAA